MFFRRSERKNTNPMLTMTVAALAMVGAFSVVRCTKRMMRCTCNKMTSVVKHMMGNDGCECGMQ